MHDDGERIVGRITVHCGGSPDDKGVGVAPGTFCGEGGGDVAVAAEGAHPHIVICLRLQAREHQGFAGGAGSGNRPGCIADGFVGNLVGVWHHGVPLLPRHERGTARNLDDLKMSWTAGVLPGEGERGLRDEVLACAVGDIRPAAVAVVVAQVSIGGGDAVKIGGPVNTRGGRGELQHQVAAIIYEGIVKVEGYSVVCRHRDRPGIGSGKGIGIIEVTVLKLILVDNLEFRFKDTGPRSDGGCLQIKGDGGDFRALHVGKHRSRINHLISQKIVGISCANG